MNKHDKYAPKDAAAAFLRQQVGFALASLIPSNKEAALKKYEQMYLLELNHTRLYVGSKLLAEKNLTQRGIWKPRHAIMLVEKKVSPARMRELVAKYSTLRND